MRSVNNKLEADGSLILPPPARPPSLHQLSIFKVFKATGALKHGPPTMERASRNFFKLASFH